MLAHSRWFSPASSTTKTGRHYIAEILLKVALNTKIQIWLIWHFLGKLETFQKGKLPIVYLKYLDEAKYLTVYNVAFLSFDFERTWWRLSQKRALIWYLRVSFCHCVVCSSSIWITDSDYPFDILKHQAWNNNNSPLPIKKILK